MLVAEQLVADVFAIIFTLTAGLVLILAEEGLLPVHVGVERLERISRIVLELEVKEFALLSQDKFHNFRRHAFTTKHVTAFLSTDIVEQLAALVEQQAWHVFIAETFSAFISLNLHKFARGMLSGKFFERLLEQCTFGHTKTRDRWLFFKKLLTDPGTYE